MGVGGAVGEAAVAEALGGGVEEGDVEADVVADDHGLPEELEEGRQSFLDGGSFDDHGLRDARHDRDEGGDGRPRVDQRLEAGDRQTALVADGSDLGDLATGGGGSGGLEVEHAERDLAEGGTHVVEGALEPDRHLFVLPVGRPSVIEHVFDCEDRAEISLATASRLPAPPAPGRLHRRCCRPRSRCG